MNRSVVIVASAAAAIAASLVVAQSLRAAPPVPNFVTGLVSQAGAGAPLPGAVLEAISVTGSNPSRQGIADASGLFVVDALAQDTYSLTCRAPGFEPLTQTVSFNGAPSVAANFTLNARAGVQGSVTPATPGVSVRFIATSGSSDIGVVTDALGAFSAACLPPGTYTVVANGFAVGKSTVVVHGVSVPPTGSLSLGVIDISPATGSVGGTVSFDYTTGTGNPTGNPSEPASGVKVKVFSAGIVIAHAMTDANGGFLIPRIPPGTYTAGNPGIHYTDGDPVAPLDPGIELLGPVSGPVTVTVGQVTPIALVMQRGGSFQVRVRDANLVPVNGSTVVVTDSANAIVDIGALDDLGDGVQWCNEPLSPAQYTVTITAPGIAPVTRSLTITAGQRTLVDVIL